MFSISMGRQQASLGSPQLAGLRLSKKSLHAQSLGSRMLLVSWVLLQGGMFYLHCISCVHVLPFPTDACFLPVGACL